MGRSNTTLGRSLSRGLNAFGLELVSSEWACRAGLRPDLQEVVRRIQPRTIFDVGANTGGFREFLRRAVRYEGNIVSFEPIPSLGDHLRALASKDSRWTIESVALGATPGDLALNVSARNDFSSFLTPNTAEIGRASCRERV